MWSKILARILLILKKYLPTLLKLFYSEAKKYNFDKDLIKKNLLKDTQEFIGQQLRVYIAENWQLEGYFWTKPEEGPQPGEVLLGSANVLPTIPYNIYEYNQLRTAEKYSRNLCFGYGNMGVYSDNMGFGLSYDQQTELAKLYTETPGFDPAIGGYFSQGEKATKKYFENLGLKWESRVISTKSNDIFEVLNKNYSIALGVKLSKEIVDWLRNDWILTKNEVNGAIKYGHLLRVKIKKNWSLFDVIIIDNYKGIVKHNIYDIEAIKEFFSSDYVYWNARFVIPEIIEEKEKAADPIVEESPFLLNSKYWKFILNDLENNFKFNNYKDPRAATIADVKELITLFWQATKKK